MGIAKDVLQKEKNKIVRKLKRLKHKSNISALTRATRCYQGEMMAFKKYLDTKEAKYMKWAEAWNKTKQKYIKIGKDQSKNNWWIDEIVSLESDLSDLENQLFYLKR